MLNLMSTGYQYTVHALQIATHCWVICGGTSKNCWKLMKCNNIVRLHLV